MVGREVFKDTAFKLSEVAEQAGKTIEPSQAEQKALKAPSSDSKPPPSTDDLNGEVAEAAQVVASGAADVAQEAQHSLADKLSGDEGETLLWRLKRTVTNLRQKRDYSESVSTLSLLLQRYAMSYSRVAEDTINAAKQDVEPNPAMEKAVKNFWKIGRAHV